MQFEARCGVKNLPEVLRVFCHWATENEPSENNEYTWDNHVIVKKDAPEQFYPGRIGAYVACGKLDLKTLQKNFVRN